MLLLNCFMELVGYDQLFSALESIVIVLFDIMYYHGIFIVDEYRKFDDCICFVSMH